MVSSSKFDLVGIFDDRLKLKIHNIFLNNSEKQKLLKKNRKLTQNQFLNGIFGVTQKRITVNVFFKF